jgi:DNA-binding IclR family transcriptional regulator
MPDKQIEPRKIGATEKSFEVIETIEKLDGAGVSEIADEVDLARGTVHAHLASLVNSGYVTNNNGKYQLSLKFLNLGIYARNKQKNFDIVRRKVDNLAERTDLRVQYMIEEHWRAVYLYRAIGDKSVPTDARIGKPRYLHTTAAGKAILASYPSDCVDKILEKVGLPKITKNTVSNPDKLKRELNGIRERGYATNFQESFQNLSAIGGSIKPEGDKDMGAISISGPCHSFKKDSGQFERLHNSLMETIEEIELNIDYLD